VLAVDALAFMEKHGKAVTERVAKSAGTNMRYFSQIAHGHRRPSVELAERLVQASADEVESPLEQLDFVSLMKAKKDAA
jgi:hypothetical protein